MIINSKFAYVKKKETFEPLITTIPKGLNPIVFIEDTREMWTCGTYFSIGYPSIEISESSGSVKVSIGNSFFLLSTAGESISVRKGDGNRIIISSNALNRVDTEAPLTWDTANRKLLHMDSGVAPGSYGQSTNLGNASVFIVPNIMIDSTGHITYAQNYNVEIRDYVEQLAPSTLAGNRNVLLSYNADSESMDTSQVRKANGLLFNDSTQRLTVEGGLDTNGPVFVNHGDLSVLDGYIIGHLKGDVEGEAKPKIHLSNKPEYGGASINLYGHVKLQDILNNKPEPSSDNENINDPNITNAIAASPLMVWNAIQTAKDYADSILGSNNAMLYKGSIEAGVTYPGTYTPTGQIGNTYVVTFGSGNYIDSIGYINGEPVEVGDLVICKEDTPAATSTTWEEVKPKWTYVQTNNTGVVSGPSSSTIGQLAVFNNTKGKLIKGLPNGNVGQILSIDESGIPAWVNKPDRLNFALSFQVRGTEFIAFDGYEPKKINFIAGDNMFITSDMQGNLTLAADPGSDTVNTAGATNNPNTKLFLIGAESQTTAPQTYSNQYVYIGPDNKLYSDGKEVSTTDHNHDDRYVNVIGDTMTGALSITCSDTYPLVLNNSSGHLAIIIKNANTNKSRFGWNQEYGSYIYDYTADRYINIKSDSLYWNNTDSFLLTGNYTTTLDTRYVKKSGDSMSGVLSITTSDIHPIVITSSNEQETSINVASKGTIGYHSSRGMFLYNKASNKVLEINDDGNAYFDKNKIWHAGNDGSGSGLDADTLDGKHLSSTESLFNGIAYITGDGVMEIGRYLDFHYDSTDTSDYSTRLCISSKGNSNTVFLPTKTGTLALTTDNVASATKLQTKRTLWGQSFDGTANVDGCIRIQANEGNYCEGIRIKPYNSWATIVLGGNDLTSDTGKSANTWSIHNNNGKFYINKNSSSGSTGNELCNINGNWGICTVSPSYKLHVGGNAYITSGLTSGGDIILNQNGSTGTRQLRIQCGDNDYGRIAAGATATNAGWMEIATADDGNEPIYVRQYTGVFSTLKRTLTLLDGSGNTGIPGSLTVAGTTTSGNFNTGGRYISSYASNTYINSVTNAVLTCNYSGYGGILCAPVKGGRITLSTYPSNDNIVYLGYATSSQISAGTNALNKRTRWNADNGYWYTDGYVKNGSSDSYVLLGGGGHTTLSGLYTSHNHFERSNVDPNSIVDGPRTYESTNTANRPDTNAWHQYTILGTGDNNYCHQLSYAYAGGTNIYHRVKNGGSWGSWLTILDSSNYAGILDGRYVNVTGDTMTGKLSWSMNGVTSSISNDNSFFTHHSTNASSGHWFNKAVYVAGEIYAGTSYNQKVWHAGNDGSGSGLDADLLDGWQLASITERWTSVITLGQWSRLLRAVNHQLGGSFILNVHYTRNSVVVNNVFLITFGHSNSAHIVTLGTHNYTQIQLRLTDGGSVNDVYVELLDSGSGTQTVYCQIFNMYVSSITKYTSYTAGGGTVRASTSTVDGRLKVDNNTVAFTSDNVASATNADTVDGQHASAFSYKSWWHWSGQSGQPSWIWGGNSENNYYVYNPANFNVNYANSAGTSSIAYKLDVTGYQFSGLSFYQTSSAFDGSPADWAHYIIANHGDGASYYHYTIRLPFWGIPQYKRQTGSTSNTSAWYNFWTSENFNPDTKFNTSGGTISGAVTINNTLSVSKIKATSTYSSNYVFCADGSIRNFPALFSTNILWASYKVNTGGSGSYSRLSGNYTFITGRTREGTGNLIVTISVPSGYSKTQIMMFATGHHRQDHWANPVYASIQPDCGTGNSIRIMTADDASLNDAECIVNFILVKTS